MLGRNSYQNNEDIVDTAIQGAHSISTKLFLFEAARMDEDDIRAFLGENKIVEKEVQDRYIDYVYMYKIASL